MIIHQSIQDTLKKPLPYDTTSKPLLFLKKNSIGFTEEGVSEDALNEFHNILSKYYFTTRNIARFYKGNITPEDKKKLETIYKKMSLRQLSQMPIRITKPLKPGQKVNLPDEQFQKFKNPTAYGIWIDGRKVSNLVLDKYVAGDFSAYCISKLYGATKKGKTYTYQVDLETNAYFVKHYKKAMDRYNEAIKNQEGIITVFASSNIK